VDYGGIPVNEAGRLYALRWDASHMTVRQQQCAGYVIPYFYFAPQNYRFWEERNPYTQELVAIRMYTQTSEQTRSGSPGVRNSVVLIRGDRIERVGTIDSLPVPPGYECRPRDRSLEMESAALRNSGAAEMRR